ncbi:MAG TPA: hypothetical protein VHB21_06355 [Minicystis sp.]|nr:hypothetical protein [Minicystis sp.]
MTILGATPQELTFVALLVGLVLLAPLVPRLGDAIDRRRSRRP